MLRTVARMGLTALGCVAIVVVVGVAAVAVAFSRLPDAMAEDDPIG